MAYTDIAALSGDPDFMERVAACYAVETLGQQSANPSSWSMDHAWDMAAQPGFGEAYTYARDTDVPAPGKDPGVITDAQILAAVQDLLNPA